MEMPDLHQEPPPNEGIRLLARLIAKAYVNSRLIKNPIGEDQSDERADLFRSGDNDVDETANEKREITIGDWAANVSGNKLERFRENPQAFGQVECRHGIATHS